MAGQTLSFETPFVFPLPKEKQMGKWFPHIQDSLDDINQMPCSCPILFYSLLLNRLYKVSRSKNCSDMRLVSGAGG